MIHLECIFSHRTRYKSRPKVRSEKKASKTYFPKTQYQHQVITIIILKVSQRAFACWVMTTGNQSLIVIKQEIFEISRKSMGSIKSFLVQSFNQIANEMILKVSSIQTLSTGIAIPHIFSTYFFLSGFSFI